MRVAALVLVLVAAPAVAQAPRRLTLTEAIQTALKGGPELRAAELGVTASEMRVRGAKAQWGPRLRAEANVLYWDKPLEITFAPMGMGGMMGMTAPALTVRDQVTGQVTVSIAQPISGLIVIGRLVGLERNGVAASRADEQRSRLDAAQRASEAYLRVLQARALAEVAEKSVAQVQGQLDRAKILERGGALAAVDVLRLTSARDQARQAALRARTGVDVAAGALVLTLDLPAGTSLDVVDDLPDPPPGITWQDREVVEAAVGKRPELTGARERTAQARAGRDVAKAQLLPNILGVATYQRTEGQGTFQPKNAWFVGATLSWDLWDWGKNWSAVKEAEARAGQAAEGERGLRDQVAFDAHRRLLEARTNYETLAAARSALQAAEEAYRIQSVRYNAGAANTTDLLDAETDVSRARSGYAQARYDYYLAQAALARAVGRLPSPTLGDIHADR
jgi:outer membrane protein